MFKSGSNSAGQDASAKLSLPVVSRQQQEALAIGGGKANALGEAVRTAREKDAGISIPEHTAAAGAPQVGGAGLDTAPILPP